VQIRENQNALMGLTAIESTRRGMKEDDAAMAMDNRQNEKHIWDAERPADDDDSEDDSMGDMVGGDSLKDVTINIHQPADKPVIEATPAKKPADPPAAPDTPAPTTPAKPSAIKAAILGAALLGTGAAGAATYAYLTSGDTDTDTAESLKFGN
jgi:hypothetical protein